MNSLEIEYFLSVVNKGGITPAAQEHYVTQPSISKQIKKLEEELGVSLFAKYGRCLQLTPEGEKFYRFFSEMEERLNNLIKESKDMLAIRMKEVRIGFLQFSNIFDELWHVFDRFSEMYEDSTIHVYYYNFGNIVDALAEDKVDFVICLEEYLPEFAYNHIEFLKDMQKKVIYRESLFKGKKQPHTLDEFMNIPFILADDADGHKNKADQIRHYIKGIPFNYTPNIVFVPNIESMLLNVSQGKGVAVIDDNVFFPDGNKSIKSMYISCHHQLVMAWIDKTNEKAKRLFADEFLEIYHHTSGKAKE